MLEQLEIRPRDRILEIGTGSGYETALLAELGGEVYTVEIIRELHERAHRCLTDLEYANIHFRLGDGHEGWPDAAPFHEVVVSAAPLAVPDALIAQMEEGGRLVIPVGEDIQTLLVMTRQGGAVKAVRKLPVKFVPMTRGRYLH